MRLSLLVAAGLCLSAASLSLAPAKGQTAVQGCAALQGQAETALGASASSAPASIGYPGLADAQGCQITFTGSGAVYGGHFQAVADKLGAALTADGWVQDHNADADGPTGTATGYRKGAQAVAVSVGYDTAPGVCREDQPVASCHPTPAQMNYTITLGLRPGS